MGHPPPGLGGDPSSSRGAPLRRDVRPLHKLFAGSLLSPEGCAVAWEGQAPCARFDPYRLTRTCHPTRDVHHGPLGAGGRLPPPDG